MTRIARRLLVAVVAIGLFVSPSFAARVVAIGDIHGAYEAFLEILVETGLADDDGNWSGGDATLVQLGDFTDRGAGVRPVMDLLIQLQDQAAAAGGEVVVLMGNHEQMNVMRIDRDATEVIFESFADLESSSARDEDFDDWYAWWKRTSTARGAEPPGRRAAKKEWQKVQTPGRLGYRMALGVDGPYGTWLRSLPFAAIRGRTLFMHAGLSPAYAEMSLSELQARVSGTFEAVDRSRNQLVAAGLLPSSAGYDEQYRALVELNNVPPPMEVMSAAEIDLVTADLNRARWLNEADSPLWFRGYARWEDEKLAPHAAVIAATHDVDRIVAGHSPRADHSVSKRLEGRLYLIDTGMLAERYGGRASALEIGDTGHVTAIYPGSRVVLEEGPPTSPANDLETSGPTTLATRVVPAPPPRTIRDRDGTPLPFPDEEAIVEFLTNATIESKKPIGEGVTGALKVTLVRGALLVRSAFHTIDEAKLMATIQGRPAPFFRDSYRGQIAAYELSRMFGLDTVPPTGLRSIGGRRGSIQLWIEGASDGADHKAGDLTPVARAFMQRQLDEMWVWDELIHNIDRNEGNVLFDGDGYLWWIDHTRSFSQNKTLFKPRRIRRCSRRLLAAMRKLDEEGARDRLGRLLSKTEIEALLVRRDLVVSRIDELVAQRGEPAVLMTLPHSLPATR